MLYLEKKYIPPPALAILSQLQKDNTLDDFFLVGGTALALQLGHRLSVDIDLFIDKHPIIALKALSYFDDINHALDKPTILRKVIFSQLKKRIYQAIEKPNRLF